MDFALTYLPSRAVYRLAQFFRHWYVDGSRFLTHHFVVSLEAMDQVFAIKVTLEHFFEPLYKDYSVIGRILGIIFRSARVLIGGTVYLLHALGFLVLYLLWLAIPVVILAYAFLVFRHN